MLLNIIQPKQKLSQILQNVPHTESKELWVVMIALYRTEVCQTAAIKRYVGSIPMIPRSERIAPWQHEKSGKSHKSTNSGNSTGTSTDSTPTGYSNGVTSAAGNSASSSMGVTVQLGEITNLLGTVDCETVRED